MIVTVTPNPSLDRTLQVDELRPGHVHRAVTARTDPGGKGVNVARALAAHQIPVHAVVPMGGTAGQQLADLLVDIGVRVVPVPVNGNTRTNVTIVDDTGTVTKVNESGAQLGPAALAELRHRVEAAVQPGDWVALSGSLPPGAPDDLYADLVLTIHNVGARVAVDTSGVPLVAALDACPDLVKPNRHELEELVGHRLLDVAAVVDAAGELLDGGVGIVLASLGAEGAILVDEEGAWHAVAQPVAVLSDVGAGDASLAGYLAADGGGSEALRRAVAWGTAAVAQPGTAMPRPDDVRLDDVVLTELRPRHTAKELT